MISIITGPIHSGKSCHIKQIYDKINKGDGFYNVKLYKENNYIGQKVIHLNTKKEEILFLKKSEWKSFSNDTFDFDLYSFFNRGFLFGETILFNAMRRNLTPLFIDEIGPLELLNKGYHDIFQMILREKKACYVVIRQACLKDVIRKFEIKEYQIIK